MSSSCSPERPLREQGTATTVDPGLSQTAFPRALEGSQPSKSVTWQHRGSEGSLDQNMVYSKPFEFATCITDGGGLASTADWSTPQYSKDIFQLLRKRFESLAVKWGVVQRLMSGGGSTDSLLLPDEINIAQMELVQFLEAEGFKCDAKIEPHQPFLLDAWRAMSQLSGDVDSQLPKLLAAGVPTGSQSSRQVFGQAPMEAEPEAQLQIHQVPWSSALKDRELTLKLIDKDVKAGHLVEIPGGEGEARLRWGKNVP